MKFLYGAWLAAAVVISDQAFAASTPSFEAPLVRAQAAAITGQYIVVVHDGEDPAVVARAAQSTPLYVYTRSLLGFAAKLSTAQLELPQGRCPGEVHRGRSVRPGGCHAVDGCER